MIGVDINKKKKISKAERDDMGENEFSLFLNKMLNTGTDKWMQSKHEEFVAWQRKYGKGYLMDRTSFEQNNTIQKLLEELQRSRVPKQPGQVKAAFQQTSLVSQHRS